MKLLVPVYLLALMASPLFACGSSSGSCPAWSADAGPYTCGSSTCVLGAEICVVRTVEGMSSGGDYSCKPLPEGCFESCAALGSMGSLCTPGDGVFFPGTSGAVPPTGELDATCTVECRSP